MTGNTVEQLGFPIKFVQSFQNAKASGKPAHRFILPISLIDLSKRDEEFKIATKAKIAGYLALIQEYYPTATLEILLGDTLALENSRLETPKEAQAEVDILKKQWAEFLNLPIDQLSPEKRFMEASYSVQHQFEGITPLDQYPITLSSWSQYQSQEIKDLMVRVRGVFSKNETSPANLMDDEVLFNSENLGFVKEALQAKLKNELGLVKIDDEKFDELIQGFMSVALHHLKKLYKIEVEDSYEKKSSTQKKCNLFERLPQETRLKEIENAFCYALQETLVITDILATIPQKEGVPKNHLIWMLYTSGITDVPKNHPVIQLTSFFASANFARKFNPCSEFKVQNNNNENCTTNSSSKGGEPMLNNRQEPPVKSPSIAIKTAKFDQQEGNNSSLAGTTGSSSKNSNLTEGENPHNHNESPQTTPSSSVSSDSNLSDDDKEELLLEGLKTACLQKINRQNADLVAEKVFKFLMASGSTATKTPFLNAAPNVKKSAKPTIQQVAANQTVDTKKVANDNS